MTITVSNTNLNNSFDTWRRTTNFIATVISNNVVTVNPHGSADRSGNATGNGMVEGTFAATVFRTPQLQGGNTAYRGDLLISTNTTIGDATDTNPAREFIVYSNTTFHSNVDFNTTGSDRIIMGDISRIRVSGGSQGQFLRITTQTDTPEFKSLELRDITDMSTNSAHIILSGANSIFSDTGDSTHLIFGSGNDRAHMYLAKGILSGDSDVYLNLVATDDGSSFVVADSSNTAAHSFFADGTQTITGRITSAGLTSSATILGDSDDTVDIGSSSLEFKDLYLDGVAYLDTLSLSSSAGEGVDTDLVPTADGTKNIGSATYEWNNAYFDGTIQTDALQVDEGATVSGQTDLNGDVNIGNADTDTLTITSKIDSHVIGATSGGTDRHLGSRTETWSRMYANSVFVANTLIANTTLTNEVKILENGKLFANNALGDGDVRNIKLENDHYTIATNGSGSGFDVHLGDTFSFDQGQGINVTLSADKVTVAGKNATASQKGVASFDSGEFLSTSGAITLADSATGAVLAISGTSNEVDVSRTNGTVTVGLPNSVTITEALTAGKAKNTGVTPSSSLVKGQFTANGNVVTIGQDRTAVSDKSARRALFDNGGLTTLNVYANTVFHDEVSLTTPITSTGAGTFGALTATGDTNLKGNMIFGDATSDTITVTGSLISDVLVSAANRSSLGGEGTDFHKVYANSSIDFRTNQSGTDASVFEDVELVVHRGTHEDGDAKLIWDESEDYWALNGAGTSGKILTSGDSGLGTTGLDLNDLTVAAPASTDLIAFYDVSTSSTRKATIANAALQGVKGQKGDDGQKGQKGEVGQKGQKGEVGQKGQKGEVGQKGQKGDDGQKGQKGDDGQKGQKGEAGTNGTNGTNGAKGQKGEAGTNGTNGTNGAKGQKGEAGTNGTNGTNGAKGQKGEVGQKGQKGEGVTGEKGNQGDPGVLGISAGNGIDISVSGVVSVETDLVGDVWVIGRDNNDKYNIGTTQHNWYLDGAEDMRLSNNGQLDVEGSVVAHSSTVSDINLKEKIEKVTDAISKIQKLNGYTFNYKKDGRAGAGIIAQEVEEVLPSAVQRTEILGHEGEHLIVEYDQLTALLIESIKELKAEIDELKGK
jgi:hypothetical protein